MNARKNSVVKKTVDAAMTVLLLFLVAYPVTGETLHEWFGMGMTVLLIEHHVLNRKWYAALFKGRYNAWRIVCVTLNALLLISIALTAVCGMSMSAHAVPFLYGLLPVSFARRFHLAMSYWSFVLMGLHLGLHLPAMAARRRWSRMAKRLSLGAFACVAALGFAGFVNNGIPDYLFFRTPFALFDFRKAAVLVFAENLASLLAFAFLGCVFTLLHRARMQRKSNGK